VIRVNRVSTLLLGGLVFLAPFSIDVSLAGLPSIAAALHAPGGLMQWTLSAFVLATGGGQLVWGPVSDRFGRRPVILIGLAIYVIAAFACAVVSNVGVLIALRFVQGLGSCAGSVCAYAVIQDLMLPPRERASRQALLSAINNVGPLAAPIAGVWILSTLGWRPLYAIPAMLGAIVLVAVALLLPETSPKTPGAAFERYLRVLALPRTLAFAVMIFALFAGYFAMISGSPFVLVAQLHVSTTAFAIAFAIEAASGLVGSFVASRLAKTTSSERLLAVSLVVALAAAAANGAAGVWAPSPLAFILTMSLYAFAFGVALPSAYTLALADAGSDAGVASGLLGAGLSLGGAAGSAISGVLPFVASVSTGIVVTCGGFAAMVCYRASLRVRG
jgi:DHA1 family bicyclomycin/chloramphenicol resistance-like MFS transporter